MIIAKLLYRIYLLGISLGLWRGLHDGSSAAFSVAHPVYGVAMRQGRRATMEDRLVVHQAVLSRGHRCLAVNYTYAAVFDGHEGSAASDMLAQQLHKHVNKATAAALRSKCSLDQPALQAAITRIAHQLSATFLQRARIVTAARSLQINSALPQMTDIVVSHTNEHIDSNSSPAAEEPRKGQSSSGSNYQSAAGADAGSEAAADNASWDGDDGSTAVFALLAGKQLLVGNVGNSRAILCSSSSNNSSDSSKCNSQQASRLVGKHDSSCSNSSSAGPSGCSRHSTRSYEDSNSSRRCCSDSCMNVEIAANSFENPQPLRPLVLTTDHTPARPSEAARVRKVGGQISSTASGKPRLKGELEVTRSFGDLGYQDQGLIATPEYTTYALQPGDAFLVLASDGVFEVMGPDDVCEHAWGVWTGSSSIRPTPYPPPPVALPGVVSTAHAAVSHGTGAGVVAAEKEPASPALLGCCDCTTEQRHAAAHAVTAAVRHMQPLTGLRRQRRHTIRQQSLQATRQSRDASLATIERTALADAHSSQRSGSCQVEGNSCSSSCCQAEANSNSLSVGSCGSAEDMYHEAEANADVSYTHCPNPQGIAAPYTLAQAMAIRTANEAYNRMSMDNIAVVVLDVRAAASAPDSHYNLAVAAANPTTELQSNTLTAQQPHQQQQQPSNSCHTEVSSAATGIAAQDAVRAAIGPAQPQQVQPCPVLLDLTITGDISQTSKQRTSMVNRPVTHNSASSSGRTSNGHELQAGGAAINQKVTAPAATAAGIIQTVGGHLQLPTCRLHVSTSNSNGQVSGMDEGGTSALLDSHSHGEPVSAVAAETGVAVVQQCDAEVVLGTDGAPQDITQHQQLLCHLASGSTVVCNTAGGYVLLSRVGFAASPLPSHVHAHPLLGLPEAMHEHQQLQQRLEQQRNDGSNQHALMLDPWQPWPLLWHGNRAAAAASTYGAQDMLGLNEAHGCNALVAAVGSVPLQHWPALAPAAFGGLGAADGPAAKAFAGQETENNTAASSPSQHHIPVDWLKGSSLPHKSMWWLRRLWHSVVTWASQIGSAWWPPGLLLPAVLRSTALPPAASSVRDPETVQGQQEPSQMHANCFAGIERRAASQQPMDTNADRHSLLEQHSLQHSVGPLSAIATNRGRQLLASKVGNQAAGAATAAAEVADVGMQAGPYQLGKQYGRGHHGEVWAAVGMHDSTAAGGSSDDNVDAQPTQLVLKRVVGSRGSRFRNSALREAYFGQFFKTQQQQLHQQCQQLKQQQARRQHSTQKQQQQQHAAEQEPTTAAHQAAPTVNVSVVLAGQEHLVRFVEALTTAPDDSVWLVFQDAGQSLHDLMYEPLGVPAAEEQAEHAGKQHAAPTAAAPNMPAVAADSADIQPVWADSAINSGQPAGGAAVSSSNKAGHENDAAAEVNYNQQLPGLSVVGPSRWWTSLRKSPQGHTFVASMMQQLLQGLAAVQAANVSHRDVKPENMLVQPVRLQHAAAATVASTTASIDRQQHKRQQHGARGREKDNAASGDSSSKEGHDKLIPDPNALHLRLIDFGSAVDAGSIAAGLYSSHQPSNDGEDVGVQNGGVDGPSLADLTLEYAPPEVLFSSRYRHPLAAAPSQLHSYDMWSAGVVMLELVLGTSAVFTPSPATRAAIHKALLRHQIRHQKHSTGSTGQQSAQTDGSDESGSSRCEGSGCHEVDYRLLYILRGLMELCLYPPRGKHSSKANAGSQSPLDCSSSKTSDQEQYTAQHDQQQHNQHNHQHRQEHEQQQVHGRESTECANKSAQQQQQPLPWSCSDEALLQLIASRDPTGKGLEGVLALRLLQRLLAWEPLQRPTAAQALQHAYLTARRDAAVAAEAVDGAWDQQQQQWKQSQQHGAPWQVTVEHCSQVHVGQPGWC